MTNLDLVEVNMHVNDIITREEYQAKKNEEERQAAEERRRERQDRLEQNRGGQYSDGSRVQQSALNFNIPPHILGRFSMLNLKGPLIRPYNMIPILIKILQT